VTFNVLNYQFIKDGILIFQGFCSNSVLMNQLFIKVNILTWKQYFILCIEFLDNFQKFVYPNL
jgi:hypothetical protein